MPSPETILKSTFGNDSFRPLQREVIGNVLARRDSLAIMPTGGGKSLCYQIPALLFDGLTVVVSPLIALMKDQVEQMRAAGVPALFLNSTLSPEAYSENMDCVRRGHVALPYHAGLDSEARSRNQEAFIRDDVQIISSQCSRS